MITLGTFLTLTADFEHEIFGVTEIGANDELGVYHTSFTYDLPIPTYSKITLTMEIADGKRAFFSLIEKYDGSIVLSKIDEVNLGFVLEILDTLHNRLDVDLEAC